ncbi:hypothetical protein ITP53_30570 [Nonomuraea sp. K274]|uniref:Uncharacterized protein n=1 Tax=Nonomuraea cypriaca TaxID=1187855 RepID=A0A931F106_9ACTN|nr:hypothetical protein [Nonomuraea cypriaca]MBF8189995.1 hypothetical protein [Nonomuraea cypriaca]
MPDEQPTETGNCYACKREFSYDPKEVTTFLVDLATGLPPGLTAFGTIRPATPEAVQRSVDLPVCPDCVAAAKRAGEAGGLWR